RSSGDSRTTSRKRLRTRLRSTALPTFWEQVKPTRTGPSSLRSRAWSTNPPAGALAPPVAARKSARLLSRCIAGAGWPAPVSGAEPLASTRSAGGQDLATPHGLEAVAKAMTALAHQLAGLIGPLHESRLRFAVACGLIRRLGKGVKCRHPWVGKGDDLPQISGTWGAPEMGPAICMTKCGFWRGDIDG